MGKLSHHKIAVIDFGGQYAHLIATKIRRHRVLAEIRQPEDPVESLVGYHGIILSGSPSLSSHGEDQEHTAHIMELDVPVLGLCFGHQEIARHYGGTIVHGGREWGRADLHLLGEHPLFSGLSPVEQVWMSHFDSVVAVGPDFEELGYSVHGETKEHRFAAIGSEKLRRYGFQFHPEVDDTIHGDDMLGNFVLRICGCQPSWTMERYVEATVERLREEVGEQSVFLLASGGVDSTVAAKLLALAVGDDRLHLLHIDNGLMRKDESRRVVAQLGALGLDRHLHFVDASEDFLSALNGETDPEKKRHSIGATFIEVFEREAMRLAIESHLLGQGTIYPDTIETGGTKRADIIKTHHNRVPVIERMIADGRVVEPLAELYKVEVRELGEMLGLPREAVWRHPFPGPGLGVRLLCSRGETPDRVTELQAEVSPHGAHADIEAKVLPIWSVGVKADLRSYEQTVLLSGTAGFETMLEVSGKILNAVHGINRCLWNLAPDAPQELEPLAAAMNRDRLDLLREADHIVMEGLRRHGLYDAIWQCPTVLVPLRIDGKGEELCVIRPVHSARAMTATAAALPEQLIAELRDAILPLPGISGLALDLTSKPPGTIEWE